MVFAQRGVNASARVCHTSARGNTLDWHRCIIYRLICAAVPGKHDLTASETALFDVSAAGRKHTCRGWG